MKNLIISILLVLVFSLNFVSCGGDDESEDSGVSGKTGSIYGVVTDKATGEMIKNAGVELLPVGLKTVTGSDGSFEFLDISAGHYNLLVTKTGYSETKSSDITVKAGKQSKGDIQLEKAPAALRVLDDEGNDISELDFGAEIGDVSRSFNIFNDSPDSINWEITKTAEWIKSVSKEAGELKAGGTLGIIVVIDRTLLHNGENTTKLHVTSNNGNKQLTIKATNSDILTLDATEVTASSAILNGKFIINDADYTEIGFVYGEMDTPSLANNALVARNYDVKLGIFSNKVSDLGLAKIYYFRAYAKNDTQTVYGETKEFTTAYVTLPDGLVVAAIDVGDIDWDSARDLCENSTFRGFSDWRLPTKDELITVYNNKDLIGNFVVDWYWSSSTYEDKTTDAWCIDFNSGTVTNCYKLNLNWARCVRTEN